METLQNLFMPRRPSDKKRLMNLTRAAGTEKFAEKAIEHLAKKLKQKPQAIDELQRSIENPGLETKCVTILRSMDGRLQIDRRKGLPHVVYCRLWRWSDLNSHHQLRALRCCKHPYSSSRDPEVCINPYHYERVETKNFVVNVPKRPRMMPPGASASTGFMNQAQNPRMSMPQNVNLEPIASFPIQQQQQHQQQFQKQEMMDYQSSYVQPQNYFVNDQQPVNPYPMMHQQQVTKPDDTVRVSYSEECDWAKLVYFEQNTRVGDVFHCSQNEVTVDGYTNPQNDQDRFCLGGLSNINRNQATEKVRRHIGKGLTLSHCPEVGQVQLKNCQSEHAVFVQSPSYNCLMGYQFGTVVKVHPNQTMQVFDLDYFNKVLNQTVKKGFEAVFDLTKMCTIRVSFVKGWGAEYQRADVTATPCWLEIHLNSPLKWLDKILKEMPCPADYISSVS